MYTNQIASDDPASGSVVAGNNIDEPSRDTNVIVRPIDLRIN